MQFSKDELRALVVALAYAEVLVRSVYDVKIRPSPSAGRDVVSFAVPNAEELFKLRDEVRELVDPNGLKALAVKARDMLALVGESAGAA